MKFGTDFRNYWKLLATKVKDFMAKLINEDLSNQEKRDATIKFIMDNFDIPYFPAWLEKILYNAIIEVIYSTFIEEETKRIKEISRSNGS